MADTVLIALITFASGFVGALFGFLTARMSAKEQQKREAHAALFQARITAYTEFLEALEKWATMVTDENAKAYLFRKTAEAALLASDKTWSYLDKVQLYALRLSDSVTDADRLQFLNDKSELIKAMREDLDCQDAGTNSK